MRVETHATHTNTILTAAYLCTPGCMQDVPHEERVRTGAAETGGRQPSGAANFMQMAHFTLESFHALVASGLLCTSRSVTNAKMHVCHACC